MYLSSINPSQVEKNATNTVKSAFQKEPNLSHVTENDDPLQRVLTGIRRSFELVTMTPDNRTIEQFMPQFIGVAEKPIVRFSEILNANNFTKRQVFEAHYSTAS